MCLSTCTSMCILYFKPYRRRITVLEGPNGKKWQALHSNSLLCFRFWEPVYYELDGSEFPSESTEKLGHFVEISENVVGHVLTSNVLTYDTNKFIYRSCICTSLNPNERKLRVNPIDCNLLPIAVKSRYTEYLLVGKTVPKFEPADLIGYTFLKPLEVDG